LLTLEGVLGVASLQPGQPLVLTIVHQTCAIAVLAAAFAPRDLGRSARTDMKLSGYASAV
jgi:heme A synthase